MQPGLAAILHPHSQSEFLNLHWPKVPFVVHGLRETLAPLTQILCLQSLDALLGAFPYPIQAHLPDVSDESSSVDVSSGDARKLFANRMGLLFNRVQRISPLLTTWLQALQADLGLPAQTDARCLVYATPDGKGTAPHFDQNINFVLQLQGTKRWRLAPNPHVENPTQRYTLGQPLDPELAAYAELPLPKEMPADAQEIVLKPGSLLFVPRGFWHSTEAEGEALALNFTFNQPTWIDLFTAALRSRLALSADWRELADGVASRDPERRADAEQMLDALLVELTEDLPHWRAADILAATEGDAHPSLD